LRADGSAFLMLRNTVIVNIGFSEQWHNDSASAASVSESAACGG